MRFRRIIYFLICLLPASCGGRQTVKAPSVPEPDPVCVFDGWKPGTVISPKDVEEFGIDSCFAAFMIDSVTFARMDGKSYRKDCSVPRGDLRYLRLIHFDAEGRIRLGEMVCNKSIAGDLLEIFRNLYDGHYPIEKIRLVDDYSASDSLSMADNNTSCFNFRSVGHTRLVSKHSMGLAVDINPLYNPQVKRGVVSPSSASVYADRSGTFPYKIEKGDLCWREFVRHGFQWGGTWTRLHDYQHFEKK